jgi:hypothetical protein
MNQIIQVQLVAQKTEVEPDWCIFCGLTLPDDDSNSCFCGEECECHYYERCDCDG